MHSMFFFWFCVSKRENKAEIYEPAAGYCNSGCEILNNSNSKSSKRDNDDDLRHVNVCLGRRFLFFFFQLH